MMLKGKAHGGPRDNVLITAPGSWDGIVRKTYRSASPIWVYHHCPRHPGHYVWQDAGWIWIANTEPSLE